MTDKPIIFSAPMVRALLDGRKTQTRRVIKPRRHASLFDGSWADNYVLDPGNAEWRECEIKFRIGDRLYVREAWHAARSLDSTKPRDIPRDADIEHAATARNYAEIGLKGKPRPGMFLPRWASRLTLIVTDVRVQRLQEISPEDAHDEGTGYIDRDGIDHCAGGHPSYSVSAYHDLWNSLNAKRGFGWETNPWVVALTFDVHRCNIDALKEAA